MIANVSFWLKNLGEPLAEEVCGWLLVQEAEEVQKVKSGQSLEAAGEIYPAVQRKRAVRIFCFYKIAEFLSK